MNNESYDNSGLHFGQIGATYKLSDGSIVKAKEIDALGGLNWKPLHESRSLSNVYHFEYNYLTYIRIIQETVCYYICVDPSFVFYIKDLLKDYRLVMRNNTCYRISIVSLPDGSYTKSYKLTNDIVPCVQINGKFMPLLTYIGLSLYGFDCSYIPSNGSWRDCRRENMVSMYFHLKIYYRLTYAYRSKSIKWTNFIKDDRVVVSIKGRELIESWLDLMDYLKQNHHELCYYNMELVE